MSDFFLANPGRWGATGAGTGIEGAEAIGDAKRQKKEVNVAATDAIDATLPNVLGTVIEVKKGQSAYPTWKVVVAVEKVEFTGGKGDAVATVQTPSGAVYGIATKRLPLSAAEGQKVALPRIFPDKTSYRSSRRRPQSRHQGEQERTQ